MFGMLASPSLPRPMGLLGRQGLLQETEEQRRQRELLEARFPEMAGRVPADTPTQGEQKPQPSIQNPILRRMLGDAPVMPDNSKDGFWRGGKDFTLRDGLAAALAAAGDVFAQRGGSRGGAVGNLTESRVSGLERARAAQLAAAKASAQYRQDASVAELPGMSPREFAAYQANRDQWGSNMADALSTHHAAANVGQTETRLFGSPALGGTMYQPPRLIENGTDQLRYDPATGQSTLAVQGMTDGEQYARSLGLTPGSQAWNDALRDAELRGDGPTGFANDMNLEGLRQQGRFGLESVRQGNRVTLRQTPTYQQARGRGSSGGGGIPSVRTPEEAMALPSGTRFRTPDGKIKVRP